MKGFEIDCVRNGQKLFLILFSRESVEAFLEIEEMPKKFLGAHGGISGENPDWISGWTIDSSRGTPVRITERISGEITKGFSEWISEETPRHIPAGIFNGIQEELLLQITGGLLWKILYEFLKDFWRNNWKVEYEKEPMEINLKEFLEFFWEIIERISKESPGEISLRISPWAFKETDGEASW